ncbi:transposon Tf2-9 polyprotein [Trichonephila inaurata madagascariensis]|uniref:Transposon Tf2-9 polyprotein n=1 Tax=Trichonephila inaurata madagascariensis TaxID=2747483 RepID=A0A8X6XLX4_9ARAC|nr:transposon Tf2-9 polyprotein [Trichonephila inaurata madagascariensis]
MLEGSALRLPVFWRNKVALWIRQCDSAFVLSQITQDETKYAALRLIDPLTKLSTKGERFTGSEPQIKTLAASLDLEYSAILRDFPDLTRPPPFNEKIKHNTFHYIETFGPPVHARARKLNPQQSEAANKNFNICSIRALLSLLNQTGVLHCTWCPKDTKLWRPSGDYRALNKQTRPDRYSIPNSNKF